MPNYLLVRTLGIYGGRHQALVFTLFIMAMAHFLAAIFLVNVAHMKGQTRKSY